MAKTLFFLLQIGLAGKIVTTIGPWLFRHRQAVTLPIVEKFLKVCEYVIFILRSKIHL